MPKSNEEEIRKRKVVLILVEGASDKTALGLIEKFYRSRNLKVYITNGDITSNGITTVTNCTNILKEIVREFREDKKLEKEDISEIIHIIDTDGAFIPDDCIEVDKILSDFYYTLDCIKANSKRKVKIRNDRKIEIIKKLLETEEIDKTIKYRMFYMSCNLDHVLYNEINLETEEKRPKAFEFRRVFNNDKNGFVAFFNSSECKANGDYRTTWNFIQQGKNSLKRYNNWWIFLNELEVEENK
ncbi:hypothetical protein [uncultured Fusobacterium sp.]|uniref:hypothetical protein n=1 Tax=uncultured Fusobacterium sp. TaxID=159267 RepID=UPI002595682C|nr:hypothetical protein [uncultured Fusobacterium sp.]